MYGVDAFCTSIHDQRRRTKPIFAEMPAYNKHGHGSATIDLACFTYYVEALQPSSLRNMWLRLQLDGGSAVL